MTVSALPPGELRRSCDPKSLGFSTTSALKASQSIPGQKRALDALLFGAAMKHDGYNIFVAGNTGLGKRTMAQHLLKQRAKTEAPPRDWVYVNDFDDPQTPNAIGLPRGRGISFRDAMAKLVKILHEAIPAMFSSDDYRKRRDAIEHALQQRQADALDALNEKAATQHIALMRTPMGFSIAPVRENEAIPQSEFDKLPDDKRRDFQEKITALQSELEALLKQFPLWEQQHREQIQQLNEEFTSNLVSHFIDDIIAEFSDLPMVVEHLQSVQKDLIANVIGIMQLEQMSAKEEATADEGTEFTGPMGGFNRYSINLLVSHDPDNGAPVIFEHNPTMGNLIGRIEHISRMGTLATNFRLIKAGSLHRANGGYLIISATKLLTHPFAWESLKRCLQSKSVDIETPAEMLDLVSTVSLDPEPIPLDMKVILIGDYRLYNLLCRYDPEFSELFKVIADFDDHMPRNADNQAGYSAFLAGIIDQEELKAFSSSAIARVIDESIRMTGDSTKISSHITATTDLLREADFFAGQASDDEVAPEHVQQAIDAKEFRRGRIRQHLQENIQRDITLIDSDGEKTGQVNGLSVYETGGFMFGQPSRITCRTRPGSGKIIDIEREVELGGPLHSKGVLILSGFLGSKFALETPLSLYASLVFEQSYGGVDGDSASSAELYALLSSLSGLPLKQSLAVTGSVNQHGDVQAIGGVNQKIEGFFDICKARGLTGSQGVLIPKSNLDHLMLRPDVVEAARTGKFHIYPVAHIDEGIELLSGVPAGKRQDDGTFPESSLYKKVEDRLTAFARTRRAFAKPPTEKND